MSKSAVCTIITKNYLPYARTLANSLKKHNQDVDLYVLLADQIDGYFEPSLEPFKFIYLEYLSEPETIKRMCFYYTAFELCCGLRGLLHEYMFEKTDAQKWLFLDADIMVNNSLDTIWQQLENSSILLTPHSMKPFHDDWIDPYELNFLRTGLYNAGFLGLRKTDSSQKFISWFKNRLKNFAFNDYYNPKFSLRGLFVDQLWLNLIPLYFEQVQLCLEPGANLGHWNLFHRQLSKDELGNFMVNGSPLLFTHFSGWNINNIDIVSKYAPIYENTPELWLEISRIYKDMLLKNGYEKFLNYPYTFNCFQNGKIITLEQRRKYYDYLVIHNEMIMELSPFSHEVYNLLTSATKTA